LFPEIAKDPAEFLVRVKLHGMAVPDALYAVNTPTTVPAGALLDMVELLMLIVIFSPIGSKQTRMASIAPDGAYAEYDNIISSGINPQIFNCVFAKLYASST
jgi:hypothetical protein